MTELCRMAGADEALIPQWIDEDRRQAEVAKLPPFSRPGRAPRKRRRRKAGGRPQARQTPLLPNDPDSSPLSRASGSKGSNACQEFLPFRDYDIEIRG